MTVIVPGSGGKDNLAFFTSCGTKQWDAALNGDFGAAYPHGGDGLPELPIHAGHDNILMTPNGRVHRLLTRLAVDNLFHPFRAFMFGEVAGTRCAARFR